jgi:adenine-specific DNA-methyltransferase
VRYINPFSYTLKVRLFEVSEPQEVAVDIPETFNYLLGLKVKKIKARENNGKRYIFTLGEKDGKNIVVVWREYSDEWSEEDFKRDEEFVINEISQWNPDVIYINGKFAASSSLGEVRYIEPEFERLLEGEDKGI